MCGRYTLQPGDDFFDRFFLDPDYERGGEVEDNFNVTPGAYMPIITKGSKYNDLTLMRWGMVPSWAKDPKIGFKMINARADSITAKPSFRVPFKRHRCLVPANGFYEWKKEDRHKIPYYFTLKDESLFAMAGLFDRWLSPDGSELQSFTIITTEPNESVGVIHDRMPVIINPKLEKLWLDESTPENDLVSCLKPYPAELMNSTVASPTRLIPDSSN